MALRNLVLDGDPILKKVCRPVEKFDQKLATLLDDMGETMMAEDGMGLAGPQVGILRRVFVALEEPPPRPEAGEPAGGEADEAAESRDGETAEERTDEAVEGQEDEPEAEVPYDPVILEFINPEIIETEGEQNAYEGCLSFPGQYGAIKRPARVKVRAYDRDGQPFEYEGTGMMARCLCHESDHLNGVTIDALAEYFYNPEEPHELDASLRGEAGEEQDAKPEGEAGTESQKPEGAPAAGPEAKK